MLLYFSGCYGNLCVMAFAGDFLLFYSDYTLFVRVTHYKLMLCFSCHDHLILRERSGYARTIL